MARALVHLGEQEPVYEREITRLAKLLVCSRDEAVADLNFLLEKKRIKCIEATRMERPGKPSATKIYYLYNDLSAQIIACLHNNGPMFRPELVQELGTSSVINYYLNQLVKKKKVKRKYLNRGKTVEAFYFLSKDQHLVSIMDYLCKHAMFLSTDIPKVAQSLKSTPKSVKLDLIFLAQTGRPMHMKLRRIKEINGKKKVQRK